MVSLPMWCCLLASRRDAELSKIPKWKKYWKLLQKKDAKEPPDALEKLQFERTFLSNMIKKFLSILYTVQEKECPEQVVDFCERFLILMIDLEALLPTRRSELQRRSSKILEERSTSRLLEVRNLYQTFTTLGLEPVSIVHYTRPGSSIIDTVSSDHH